MSDTPPIPVQKPGDTLLEILDDYDVVSFLQDTTTRQQLIEQISKSGFGLPVPQVVAFSLVKLFEMAALGALRKVSEVADNRSSELIAELIRKHQNTKTWIGWGIGATERFFIKAVQSSRIKKLVGDSTPIDDGVIKRALNVRQNDEIILALKTIEQVQELGRELREFQNSLAEPRSEPPLIIPNVQGVDLDSISDTIKLDFRAGLTEFIGRDDEMQELVDFIQRSEKVRFTEILGPAGSGKSRLAYELLASEHLRDWQVGFLNFDIDYQDWDRWQPIAPTLVVLDPVSQAQHANIPKLLLALSRRSTTLEHPLRVIIIHRSEAASWRSQYFPDHLPNSIELTRIYDVNPITLGGVDWHMFQAIAADAYAAISDDNEVNPGSAAIIEDVFTQSDSEITCQLAVIAGLGTARSAFHDNDHHREYVQRRLLSAAHRMEKARWPVELNNVDVEEDIAFANIVGSVRANQWQSGIQLFEAYKRARGFRERDRIVIGMMPRIAALTQILNFVSEIEDDPARLRNFFQRCFETAPLEARELFEELSETYPQDRHSRLALKACRNLNSLSHAEWLKFRLDQIRYSRNERLFEEIRSEIFASIDSGETPDPKVTARLIGRAPEYIAARQVFEYLKSKQVALDTHHYNALLARGGAQRLEVLFKELKKEYKPNIGTYMELVRHSPREDVPRIWEMFQTSELPMDQYLIDRFIRRSKADFQPVLWNYLQHAPTLLTSLTVDSLVKNFDRAGLATLLQNLATLKVRIPHSTIMTAVKHAPGEDGLSILQFLISSGRRPRLDAFCELLKVQSIPVERVLEILKQHKYRSDEAVYTAQIGRSNSFSEALRLYREMIHKQLTPDSKTFSTLMRLAQGSADVRSLLEEMAEVQERPTDYHYGHYLNKLAIERAARDEVMAVLSEMTDLNIPMSTFVLEPLFAVNDLPTSEKLKLFRDAVDSDNPLRPRAYQNLLRALIRRSRDADYVFEKAREQETYITPAMVGAYAMSRDTLSEASRLIFRHLPPECQDHPNAMTARIWCAIKQPQSHEQIPGLISTAKSQDRFYLPQFVVAKILNTVKPAIAHQVRKLLRT
ncbi:MAG: hypothetical protein AAGD43_06680 [Pseudomonadota bacterium]